MTFDQVIGALANIDSSMYGINRDFRSQHWTKDEMNRRIKIAQGLLVSIERHLDSMEDKNNGKD